MFLFDDCFQKVCERENRKKFPIQGFDDGVSFKINPSKLFSII